jgi:NADH-quinone oxidoreductase subunit N
MPGSPSIWEDLILIQPLIVLWITSFVLLLGDVAVWKKYKDLNPILAIVGTLIALGVAFNQTISLTADKAFARSLNMDSLAQVSMIALLVTGLLAILLAWTYLKNRGLDRGEYYPLMLLSISGAILMGAANDLIVLFIGLEILSFALYVMAGFSRTDVRSEEASIKYFLLGAFASAFLLYGIALVYGATQTTLMSELAVRVHSAQTPMLLAGIGLLIMGLGFKAAVIPFHQWTPDVYEGAPTSVTAYMAGAAKIAAFAAMLRVFDSLAAVSNFWLGAIQALAILTMVFGNLLAIAQTNVKRLLAYSSIAHAGYLMVAIATLAHSAEGPRGMQARELAMTGSLFYLFAYTFMTMGAFGVLIYLSNRGKDYQQIEDLRGLVRHDPRTAYAMLFFMLSLGGIPPTMGFMGKWQIFYAALSGGETMLAIVMALTSVMAAFYYLKIVYVMCFEEPREAAPAQPQNSFGASLSVMLSAAATILFGVMPGLLYTITGLIR